MRVVLVALVLQVALPSAAGAADVVVNNGLAPPNGGNVIDDASHANDDVYVRNVDCPPEAGNPWDPCPLPGAATEVGIVEGGEVQDVSAWDTSFVALSGGSVSSVSALGSSTVTISGGTLLFGVTTSGSASVTLTGGQIGWQLRAADSSTITIVGTDFAVDGSPQPYGDLGAQSGTLTGTLESGEGIDNAFQQGGGSYAGTITLAASPTPVPALSSGGTLALVAALLASGLVRAVARRRHAVP